LNAGIEMTLRQTKEEKQKEAQFRHNLLRQRLGEEVFYDYKPARLDWLVGGCFQRQFDKLEKIFTDAYLTSLDIQHILEVGAENGHCSLWLEDHGYRCVAFDIAPSLGEAVRFFAAKLGFEELPKVVIGDAYDLPFRQGTFDCAFAFATLHHFPDPSLALKEVRHALRKGGIFFCAFEPLLPSLFWFAEPLFSRFEKRQGLSEHAFTYDRWLSFFRGFDILEVELEPSRFGFISRSQAMCRYFWGGSITIIARNR
jgi:SAM-dependent methyltransferase